MSYESYHKNSPQALNNKNKTKNLSAQSTIDSNRLIVQSHFDELNRKVERFALMMINKKNKIKKILLPVLLDNIQYDINHLDHNLNRKEKIIENIHDLKKIIETHDIQKLYEYCIENFFHSEGNHADRFYTALENVQLNKLDDIEVVDFFILLDELSVHDDLINKKIQIVKKNINNKIETSYKNLVENLKRKIQGVQINKELFLTYKDDLNNLRRGMKKIDVIHASKNINVRVNICSHEVDELSFLLFESAKNYFNFNKLDLDKFDVNEVINNLKFLKSLLPDNHHQKDLALKNYQLIIDDLKYHLEQNFVFLQQLIYTQFSAIQFYSPRTEIEALNKVCEKLNCFDREIDIFNSSHESDFKISSIGKINKHYINDMVYEKINNIIIMQNKMALVKYDLIQNHLCNTWKKSKNKRDYFGWLELIFSAKMSGFKDYQRIEHQLSSQKFSKKAVIEIYQSINHILETKIAKYMIPEKTYLSLLSFKYQVESSLFLIREGNFKSAMEKTNYEKNEKRYQKLFSDIINEMKKFIHYFPKDEMIRMDGLGEIHLLFEEMAQGNSDLCKEGIDLNASLMFQVKYICSKRLNHTNNFINSIRRDKKVDEFYHCVNNTGLWKISSNSMSALDEKEVEFNEHNLNCLLTELKRINLSFKHHQSMVIALK